MRSTVSTAFVGLGAIVLSTGVGWSVGRHHIARHVSAPPAPRQSVALSSSPAPIPLVASTPSQPAAPRPQPPLPQLATVEPKPDPSPAEPPRAPRPGNGVLIVVSLPSQRAFVFKDGEAWGSSRVSTGKRGKPTPVGRFTILEKRVMHRSNKYSNAPMPYMQRITWQGVALHAGHVPGYPASHGCIRLPRSFAKSLYGLTTNSSVVVVTNRRADSAKDARKLS